MTGHQITYKVLLLLVIKPGNSSQIIGRVMLSDSTMSVSIEDQVMPRLLPL
jgi:hypothetical protein